MTVSCLTIIVDSHCPQNKTTNALKWFIQPLLRPILDYHYTDSRIYILFTAPDLSWMLLCAMNSTVVSHVAYLGSIGNTEKPGASSQRALLDSTIPNLAVHRDLPTPQSNSPSFLILTTHFYLVYAYPLLAYAWFSLSFVMLDLAKEPFLADHSVSNAAAASLLKLYRSHYLHLISVMLFKLGQLP